MSIAGIQSQYRSGQDRQVGAETFRDWAFATMGIAPSVFTEPANTSAPGYQGSSRAFLPGVYNASQLTARGDITDTISFHSLVENTNGFGISSVKVPVNGSLTLYDGQGESRNAYTATSDILNLGSVSFDNKTWSLSANQWVTIYVDGDFGGNSDALAPGIYNFAWFYSSSHVGNDRLSAIRIPSGWRVKLFENDLSGDSTTYYGGNISWVGYNWNDRVSSIVVQEPAVVYGNPYWSGPYSVLWPGDYNTAEMGLPDNSISSLSVPNGWTVTLFRDSSFSGPSFTYNYSEVYLPNFAGQTSSIRV